MILGDIVVIFNATELILFHSEISKLILIRLNRSHGMVKKNVRKISDWPNRKFYFVVVS